MPIRPTLKFKNQRTMKTLTTFGLTIIICFSFLSSNAQSIGDFTGVKASDPINIEISQSEENTIKVNAPGNVPDQIKTKMDGDILEISVDGKIKTEKPVIIFIGIKSLKSLDISGAAEVKSGNQLNCDILNIESFGAGDVNLEVKANEIKAKIGGAGDVKLKGSTQKLDASITGAGELKAFALETNKAKVKASGAGNAKINVAESLDADVSGAGSVIYKGNPADRNVDISGAGSVKQTSNGDEKNEKGDNHISVDISLDTDDIFVEEDTLEPDDPDTTKINLKKMKILIIENEDRGTDSDTEKPDEDDEDRNKHWAGLYLGVNGFSTPQYSLNLPAKSGFMELNYAKSLHFAFNFIEKDIHLYKDYAMLVTGLGVDFNTYALKNNVTLLANNNTVWGVTDSINKFTKNKLKTTFVNVPVLLAFNTDANSDKAFHFAAGMIFGYDLITKTKQRFNIAGNEINSKVKTDYNINPFRYSATVQLGYGDYNLYASYALNSLFKGGKGPELYPFTVGIRVLGL